MSDGPALDSALAVFPLPLAPPWGEGWVTEIAVALTDGPAIVFEADGAVLRVRRGARPDP